MEGKNMALKIDFFEFVGEELTVDENGIIVSKNWDYETCECKGEPPLGYRWGTCKICNRGDGTIYVSKKTGKKYWNNKEDDKYLIPRIPLTGPEKKYGQNWDKNMHLCPRCVDAVPVFYKIDWRSASDYSDEIEIHCQKCRHYGHKDVTYIKTVDWLTKFQKRGYFRPVI
jgi:hypothetical protein